MLHRAWRLFTRGQRLNRRGRIAESAAVLEEALALLEWNPESPPKPGTAQARLTAKALMVLSTDLASLGDTADGLRLLDLAEGFAAPADRGVLLHTRALGLWQSGRLSQALHWFEEAEPHLEANGPDYMYTALFHNRANLWRDLGELEKALESIQRAIAQYERVDIPVNRAKAIHLEALIWFDLGEVTKALRAFDKVREQYRSVAPELESFIDASYAGALFSVGMYRQAAERWEEAIAAQRLAGDQRNAAMAEYWRALAAYEDNRFESAEQWAIQAMDSLYKQGNEPMAFLARLLILQGRFDSGQAGPGFVEKVVGLCQALEQRGWTLRLEQAKILAARARIKAGDLEGVAEMLQGEHGGPGHDALAEDLARYLARAELAIALDQDPMPELRAGLDLLDEYRTAFGSVEFQAGVSALGVGLSNTGLGHAFSHGEPAEMLWWAERSRAQSLRIPPVKSSADPGAREALGRLRQARQELWDLQIERKETSAAAARVGELEAEIRDYDRARPGPGEQADRIVPGEIHDLAVARETVVVNMFQVDGLVHAVLAGGDGLQHVKLMPLDEATELERRLGADLDALSRTFHHPPRLRQSVESAMRRNADVLAEGIWKPMAEYIGDRQIVIVPHSRLAWVPWPLLPPLRGRPVTVSPSAEAWWRAVHKPAATGPALVAAGPRLVRADSEIESVGALYADARVIRAEQSDPENVLEALDGASVAHLAAHGHHEPDNVLFSRLDFGLGPLNAYELLGLDQPPAHVVLSACDLGRSTVEVGNETLGFTAALLHAGTSTVVSSLARVPDEMAADMMIEYHQRCAAGATPAEALAAVGEHRPWHPFVAFGA
ncbi:CHAT domain-containing tetratricopeptide repeat protein [Glycomyces luteolus]|uniref:CHAT domain-containing tetratricopeptide repeat protein n=1 Tax=Glycomyces luteolus TaxID=2670330 RepID=A0A9X3SQ59_9ACTN|nr:CHAT domain-containing tetratricopeptide repeat protein [Glycomyces luteolus]MDA1358574.1 CHAT domain-containing tetratricopeptide repeat protein [Glycomyces luteolus]